MVNITSSKLLGFLRGVVYSVVWSASLALLTYLSDATHFNGLIDGTLATVIAGLAGLVEHQIEANGSGALYGAVIPRK